MSAPAGALHGLAHVEPGDIERRSFETIERELAPRVLDPLTAPVVKRVIHTTADFEFADTLAFSRDAMAAGVEALRAGATVISDTTMVASGVNKRVLGRFGGRAVSFIGDEDVAAEARERGMTRSAVCMERAAQVEGPVVLAIGNAPTALVRIWELLGEGRMAPPALIVATPVGFVNVVESKELICGLDVPHIVARGRKGGSAVAAAICNALLYLASNGERA
ncbi:precorrin-8X methylmutase [Eggerthellaceae bacterium zg-1084]|uniref:Precorrin-8X methylmutase n=1 Tax=Berryella wangjianweii TaxID=2734634 RepID=A0A6M8J5Y4_9ACTN|nr:precorrin-8X methylmutase [Berryella wangjianweii]NPD31340.1 precorrin-8X methylmutase [Berryella wangjianweii]NPD32351.1 precorrin-8X methylmutase [Eggerthellaceae bacterium zg-997]QKF06879.1 precorrin-8X methylmutase [Berryella wangjianweii]